MNQTTIDWADVTWNPVTGCRHNCPYCYARRIANRFGGGGEDEAFPASSNGLPILDEPVIRGKKNGETARAPYPFYFEPTFHRYKLKEPERAEHPRNIFVGSMTDLFGDWVPIEWIVQVIDACLAAPQHNYLFLTKNPGRYMELDKMEILPRKGNFWYGSTVTNEEAPYFYSDKHNTFVSVEPMQGPLHGTGDLVTDWVIVGAETGGREGRTLTKKEWVIGLADECRETGVPIYMKKNLVREGVLEPGELIRQYPLNLVFT